MSRRREIILDDMRLRGSEYATVIWRSTRGVGAGEEDELQGQLPCMMEARTGCVTGLCTMETTSSAETST